MLLKKKGFPEEGDLLLCRVTNIHYNSVFVNLEEYENKSGMIHISEISAGRIKNIREFVAEGKVIVCKVLRINMERGYIDLSLRRVNKGQQRTKSEEMKQEQRVEKLIEFYCAQNKKDILQVYPAVATPLMQHFSYIHQAFNEVVKNDADLSQWGVPKPLADALKIIIKENIKPKEVVIKGILSLTSYAPNAIEVIQGVLHEAGSTSPLLSITYAGGGKYNMVVKTDNFKTAEKVLKDASEKAIELMEKQKGTADFARAETS